MVQPASVLRMHRAPIRALAWNPKYDCFATACSNVVLWGRTPLDLAGAPSGEGRSSDAPPPQSAAGGGVGDAAAASGMMVE